MSCESIEEARARQLRGTIRLKLPKHLVSRGKPRKLRGKGRKWKKNPKGHDELLGWTVHCWCCCGCGQGLTRAEGSGEWRGEMGLARSGPCCCRFNARFSIPPILPPLPPLFTAYTLLIISFFPLKVLFIQLRLAAQFFILSPGLTLHSPLTFIQDSINMLSSAKRRKPVIP
jgi:hypothetical protein